MANSVGSTPLHKIPRSWAGSVAIDDTDIKAGGITGSSLSGTAQSKVSGAVLPTVATTGTTEQIVVVPFAGTITAARVAFKDALAQHATNYLTFAIVNKGQAGAGTTAVLAATDANTTKTTTGTAISAYTARSLALNATAGNKVVAAGDVLALQFISAATLANTLTEGYAEIEVAVTA